MIVKRDPQETESHGGIVLLEKDIDDVLEVPRITGVVESVGPEVRGVEPGERVMFTNWTDMHLEGEMMVIHEKDVLGILE